MHSPLIVLGGKPPAEFRSSAMGQAMVSLAGGPGYVYVWAPSTSDGGQSLNDQDWTIAETAGDPIAQKVWLAKQIRRAGLRLPTLVIADERFALLAVRCNELLRVLWLPEGTAVKGNKLLEQLVACSDVAVRSDEGDDMAAAERIRGELDRAAGRRRAKRRRVLYLYDHYACHIATVREYIESFGKYSRHEITYAVGANTVPLLFHLDVFDVIVVHYSVRLCVEGHLQEKFARQIEAFLGPKLLFIQDEYDKTETARAAMRRLGFDVVFTCVPAAAVPSVYPPAAMPGIKFVSVLTGAVPEAYRHMQIDGDPAKRPVFLGYRGRELPYWYGKLGREKFEIGVEVKRRLEGRGLAVDIEWSEDKRIYGDAWYDFVASCRAQLGSESGANLFDDDGSVRANIEAALRENPNLTFDEAHRRFMAERDGYVKMNQVSPRIFEAIAFRTALVLFEGTYSGVVKPHEHFIPLKKDYSNLDEVVTRLHDDKLVEAMTARAYRDVIESGRYDYRRFVEVFDAEVDALPALASETTLAASYIGQRIAGGDSAFDFETSVRYFPSKLVFDKDFTDGVVPKLHIEYRQTKLVLQHVRTKALVRQLLVRVWRPVPAPVKRVFRPLMRLARAGVRAAWK